MRLESLKAEDMQEIMDERNNLPDGILRTPYKLNMTMQMDWFDKVICDRSGTTRYWGLHTDELVGYGGIENIQWENGTGEISLMVFERHRGNGYGSEAVRQFLREAFDNMRLATVYAEVYASNSAVEFWKRMCSTEPLMLPRRKMFNGKLVDSYYFTWSNNG